MWEGGASIQVLIPRGRVEAELHNIMSQGILEPVQYPEWASPIVVALKSNKKSVCICGDFINPTLKLDQYPLPKVKDLFTKLSGGKTFTKLDHTCKCAWMPNLRSMS